jgi:hypothetical protein
MPRQPSGNRSPEFPTQASSSKRLTDEVTPLLRKASRSLSNALYGDSRPSRPILNGGESEEGSESDDEVDGQGGREVEVYVPGKSTFSQTVS